MKKKMTTASTFKKAGDDHVKPAEKNPLIKVMQDAKAPMTREEFLRFRYLGNIPEEIPAEDLADMPEMFKTPEEKKRG